MSKKDNYLDAALYSELNKNNTDILQYTNVILSDLEDKNFVKGDVVFCKFKKQSKTNDMYNIINLLVPEARGDEFKSFTEFKNITVNSNNITYIVNKKIYIYGISNYEELFKSDLTDSYITQDNLLLKEILPFSNKNEQINNICYFKLETGNIYLHLNEYKYKITLKKLIYSNLYLIIKNVNNINYYLQFKLEEGKYNYEWMKEDYNYIDNIMSKLLFINIESDNITDLNNNRTEIIESDMIMFTYKYNFKNIYSHLNKFISNDIGVCNLYDTYYTIHSKKFDKLISNDNLSLPILNLVLHKYNTSYILKDKFSKINNNIGNSKFYFSNYDCNSYMIYNSYKNIILDNSFTFIELDSLNLTLENILTNINNYKDYNINLKYEKTKNMFYELNDFCSITEKSNKLKIQPISDNEKKAKINTFYIYHISKTGIKGNLFNKYKIQSGSTETILEDDMVFEIIPINPINKKIIQTNNNGKLEDTELSIIPLNQHSEYYLISNKKQEYLRVKSLINYKQPLRVSLEFVHTTNINMDYLWYIKNNVENVESIDIKNDSSTCMYGGEKLILDTGIKNKFLTKINENHLKYSGDKYNDLCNNNTYVSFINYDLLNTQQNTSTNQVTYIACRNECKKTDSCKGFSYSDKCYLYGNPTKDLSMVYYDCNNSLTPNNHVGEIKKTETYHSIDLIDNNLYYIKCKNIEDTHSYIEFNKAGAVFGKNFLKCNSLSNTQDLYSNFIFKLKITKTNFSNGNIINGNIKLFSLLTENTHILGTYSENDTSETNLITITFENGKYVWNHTDNTKWYLESTNNIYEYMVVEGTVETNGEEKCRSPTNSNEKIFCCRYYHEGYTLLQVNVDKNKKIISVEGPEKKIYTKMYHDENVSIFKNINNISKITPIITNYEGDIFIIEKYTESSIKYYNIFSIFNNTKYYIFKDNKNSDNISFIKFNTTIDSSDLLETDRYLWSFEIYKNNITTGHSYQKFIIGGAEPNLDDSEQYGGVKKENLIPNNLYYIKSRNDKYICANKNYKINDKIPTSIAISINSKLATHPNKSRVYNNKFVRASIDLSNTSYNISKKHNIDDDILWRLEKHKNEFYRFYNIKHNIYLMINNTILDASIKEDSSSTLYYNLYEKNTQNALTIGNEDTNTLINEFEFIDIQNSRNNNKEIAWTFIKPLNYSIKNPYITDSEFKPLENGKIYRITNQGIKNNKTTNTYLTVNDLKNELLIPYNSSLFSSSLNTDPTLWKCIINSDNTYSFICVYNNYKLGHIENQNSLLKNIGNRLDFKNNDISITTEYLTDKFYIQHSNGEYYNIINSKNLNYYICGFSNNNNSYDNYPLDNIKYTHKVANNNNWLLTCKLEEESQNVTVFSDEPNYYLYGDNGTNELKYSISDKYNKIYNEIYYYTFQSGNILETIDNNISKIIQKTNEFKKYTGFTVSTNVICNITNDTFQNDNISIILNTSSVFYTIRFINFKENILLIRITCTQIRKSSIKIKEQIESNNKLFNKLDYIEQNNSTNGDKTKIINMNICAPDIYTDSNIFKNPAKINITYDNEFLNIYVNNKLITFTKIVNTLFDNVYFTSNKITQWKDILWYKHKKLLETPLWKTKNINDFKNNKPGIQFTSKLNPRVSFTATIEQKTIGYFYIKDINNKYLSINNKIDNIYSVEFITDLPQNDDNCLWKLYDTNIDEKNKLKVLENEKNEYNKFILNSNDLKITSNLPDDYIDNVSNSTNFMLKTRLNRTTNNVDNVSNYEYSIIDIDNIDGINEKICSWLANKNGHTSVDYNSHLLGTHFTTDIWNLQYIMGKNPTTNSKFLVKYKNDTGIVELDPFVNNKTYGEFGLVNLSVKGRWTNFEKIKNFSSIKSQNNIYINEIKSNDSGFKNACISLDNDPLNPGAYCAQVEQQSDCDEANSVLYIPEGICTDVLYKNYKLLNGEKLYGGNINNIKGGNIWIQERYFYLNKTNSDGQEIFNNITNVTYIPNFDTTDSGLLDKWTYNGSDKKNSILTIIYNSNKYDGYIEDIENKIIRAVILPDNFILLTNSTEATPEGVYEKSNYIHGRIKSYIIGYKNIKVVSQNFFSVYNTYYINIKTEGSDSDSQSKLSSVEYKLNKCYDLITNNICISGANGQTRMAENIVNHEFLLENFSDFKNTDNNFRIVNIYGKYLCDLYINNTYLCEKVLPLANKIVFQGQYDFINLEHNNIHHMHSTSFESLWRMVYNEINDTYKIINSYTNKLLEYDGHSDFKIEYIENKYFKQKFVNKTDSRLIYNREDTFYIYYITELDTKNFLYYEDVLVNNEYTKTSIIRFSKKKNMPFIIKKANYNLDILTDEFKNLPSKITNICYNKKNICTESSIIPLISNITSNCLDMNIILEKKYIVSNKNETGAQNIWKNMNKGINELISLLNKIEDNSIILQPGIYRLIFNIKNINILNIKYAFTTIMANLEDIKVKISAMYDNKEVIIEDLMTLKNSESLRTYEVPFRALGNDVYNTIDVIFFIELKKQATLNFIELYGTPMVSTFKREHEINNTKTNTSVPVSLMRSLISKKINIENNLIKIKYITNNEDISNTNTNIVSFIGENNTPIINNDNTIESHTILTFNPLLNCYMFYIKNNKYLNIENSNKTNYINGYYFKLIESTIFQDAQYKLFNIQCFDNSNLYVNVNTDKGLYLGLEKHVFMFINVRNVENIKNNLIKHNKLINNNILYNFYTKHVYIYKNINGVNKYYNIPKSGNIAPYYALQKTSLLIQKITATEWLLKNPDNHSDNTVKLVISNLINVKDNIYKYKLSQNIENDIYIELVCDYNNLNIYTNESYKKTVSFNDINKTTNQSIETEHLKRNTKYLTHNKILDNIILNNIISFKNNGSYLMAGIDNKLIENTTLDSNGYFVEIKLNTGTIIGNSVDDDYLCKLWHYKHKKLIKYDENTNLFVLDNNIIEYNDIDILNDIDKSHTFQTNGQTSIFYKLYYIPNKYLNINGTSKKEYVVTQLTDIHKFDHNTYEDYCNKICLNSNYIEDKLMNNKIYNIGAIGADETTNGQLVLSLEDYTITFLTRHPKHIHFFEMGNITEINQSNIIPLNNFKEKHILENIFGTKTDLNLLIVTINISQNTQERKLSNIIIWNNNNKTYGRFENVFDEPDDIKGEFNIIYDSNYNILEDNNYVFTSYTSPPTNKKYVKIKNLDNNIINKFKISLFHYNNTVSTNTESNIIKTPDNNILSNIRKLNTTCAWGECQDDNNISVDELNNISANLRKYEDINKLSGGMLDSNMLRFLKHIDNDDIDFYKSSINNQSYVNSNTTYYDSNKLKKIIFKKNDIVEIHKIFGIRGWTNSYNSLYNKSLFMINSATVNEIDYYDTFRNIYPISLLEKKYAFNSENLWKPNNWFEDSPHFRSLPFWKFEEVYIGKNSSDTGVKSFEITGGVLNNSSKKKNVNNRSSFFKKFSYLLIIIIVLYYIYKTFLQ